MFFNRFGKHASPVRPTSLSDLKEPLPTALISQIAKKSDRNEVSFVRGRRALALALAAQVALPIGMLSQVTRALAQTPAPDAPPAPATPATAPAADATPATPPTAPATPVTPAPATPAPADNATPAPATPAPTPVAPTPAPAPAAPATITPTGSNDDKVAGQALDSARKYQHIQQQQSAYLASQLVSKARDEQANSQLVDAQRDFAQAAKLDPNNEQARDGYRNVTALLGGERLPAAEKQDKTIGVAIQAINYRFNSAINRANDDIAAQKWADAQRDIEEAKIARNNDPTLFTTPQLNDFDTIVSNAEIRLTTAKQQADNASNDVAQKATQQSQAQKEAEYRRDKEQTIAGLIQDARQYTDDGKYIEALAVVDHIQQLDPTNAYAGSVRQFLQDKANIQRQRTFSERYDAELTHQLVSAKEKIIPYEDIVRYADDWPKISEMRDDEVAADRGEDKEDAALQAQLDRHLPELRFNANALSDVIDFLRDVSGANIYVDWPALERASIAKDAQVTARLRDVKFSKALELIFKSVEGEDDDHKLGYTLDEGVITISTRKELNKNTVTRRYDINDLLFVAPDYNNAPDLSLQNAGQGQTAGGGGGGGGGQSQGLFTNTQTNSQTQNSANDRSQRIDEIKQYITQNVDNNSWKDNGGDTGSISSSPLRAVLLITQTPENQHKIQAVLDSLRASQALQVSIETRFLVVQRNYLEDIGVDANFTFNPLQNAANSRSGYNSSRFSPITVNQSAVTDNTTFKDANGNIVANSAQGSRTLDWISNVGNAAVPGSIAADPADYPNPVVIQGSYIDNFTVNFLIRAVQANQTTVNLTAPRLTLFSGQRALLVVQTQQAYVSGLNPIVATGVGLFEPQVSTTTASGVVLSVLATVSPDRKYVFLDLQPQLARLRALVPFSVSAIVTGTTTLVGTTNTQIINGTLQLPTIDLTIVKTSCSCPDGATLLLGGQTLAAETTREQGVPVLSKIPFLKRLFTNRANSQDEQILLILVKPTILIQPELEKKQFPQLSTKAAS